MQVDAYAECQDSSSSTTPNGTLIKTMITRPRGA